MAGFAQLNVRIPVDVDERYDRLSRALGRRKTELVTAALRDGLRSLEELARDRGIELAEVS